jgi:hypothetical protein
VEGRAEECDLKPAKKGRKLPKVLTADKFRRFNKLVDPPRQPPRELYR